MHRRALCAGGVVAIVIGGAAAAPADPQPPGTRALEIDRIADDGSNAMPLATELAPELTPDLTPAAPRSGLTIPGPGALALLGAAVVLAWPRKREQSD